MQYLCMSLINKVSNGVILQSKIVSTETAVASVKHYQVIA